MSYGRVVEERGGGRFASCRGRGIRRQMRKGEEHHGLWKQLESSPDSLYLSFNPPFHSSGSSNNRRYQRSELRSNVPLTSPLASRRPRPAPGGDPDDDPASSNARGPNSDFTLSQQAPTTDAEGRANDTRRIWGTTVSVGETMYLFREFIHNFKLKYRLVWQKENGLISTIASDDREDGEKLIYVDYLRRMRFTSQLNLNLNINDLEAYPSTKKLATSLKSFPAEVVAMLDQVLKDETIEIAESDKNSGRFGMDGEDANEILSNLGQNIYKCRPFGVKSANMRSLNPKGEWETRERFPQATIQN